MRNFYKAIDLKANNHAATFKNSTAITKVVTGMITNLYKEVESDKTYNNQRFESAYQLSITPLFEFYLGRFLYHLSADNNYGWSIYVRRQIKKCAHKSQGLTLDNVIIDLDSGVFASGQVYVALSRCCSIDNIRLKRPLLEKDILINPVISRFYAYLRTISKKDSA
jgi:hypothetical protein